MTVYYSVYAIMCFVALISQHMSQNLKYRHKMICIIGFTLIFGILALRHWSMGNDLGFYVPSNENSGYIPSFMKLNTYSWKEILKMKSFLNYEKGYVIFNKLVGSIYCNKQFFLGVCAFINISVTAVTIYRKSRLPLLSWIVFMGLPVFLMFFSGMRQSVAISITMIATHWIEEKKPIKFILTVLLASTFHQSAIVFLIAYPVYHMELTDFRKVVCIVMLPVVYILRGPLFAVLSKIFKDNAEVTSTGAGTLFIVFFAIYITMAIFNSYSKKNPNKMINLFYVACVCQAFSGIYNLAMRVGYYFMIYLIIALPNTVYEFKKQEVRTANQEFILSYTVIFAAFLIFGIYSIANGTWAHTNPYHFFWQSV